MAMTKERIEEIKSSIDEWTHFSPPRHVVDIRELIAEMEWLQPRFLMLNEHKNKTDEYVKALQEEVERLTKENQGLYDQATWDHGSAAEITDMEKRKADDLKPIRQARTKGHQHRPGG